MQFLIFPRFFSSSEIDTILPCFPSAHEGTMLAIALLLYLPLKHVERDVFLSPPQMTEEQRSVVPPVAKLPMVIVIRFGKVKSELGVSGCTVDLEFRTRKPVDDVDFDVIRDYAVFRCTFLD